MAPVAANAPPPIWLEVLRDIVDQTGYDLSAWTVPRSGSSAQQDPLAVAAAASVWIGGGVPGASSNDDRGAREAWVKWYGAKFGPLISMNQGGSGKWLVISNTEDRESGGVNVRAGVGWAASTVNPQKWEDWGRSPLEAAWNVPAGWKVGIHTGTGPPPIVLPPFASWLRVVLRGGPTCVRYLEGYLRRMAREVYLPCEFCGASGEMARQWLGALIKAEAEAEARAKKNVLPMSGGSTRRPMEPGSSETNSAARRLAVKVFFREELLRFGSGEAPVAPVGGPLTWLWPLEAVVTACGRNGPIGSGSKGLRKSDDTEASIVLESPPSALARALSAVPYDLLCGSRRFGSGGDYPKPAPLRAFVMRAADLAARALATRPCRHWSVARQLLLGLGLLYNALAKPDTTSSELQEKAGIGPTEGVEKAARGARDGGEAAATQKAALFTIESLVRIALGSFNIADSLQNDASAQGESGNRIFAAGYSGAPALSSACRALRPLETGSSTGLKDLVEALRGAGAWRAAAAFFGQRGVVHFNAGGTLSTPTLREDRDSAPGRELGGAERRICGKIPNGYSAQPLISSHTERKEASNEGEGLRATVQDAHLLTRTGPKSGAQEHQKKKNYKGVFSSKKMKPVLIGVSTDADPPASSPRRTLPARATRRSERVNDA